MNRLVIIGNGFDLFHELKTSYVDFLISLIVNTDLYDGKIIQKQTSKRRPPVGSSPHTSKWYMQQLNKEKDLKSLKGAIPYLSDFFKIDSQIIKVSLNDIENKGWTDIEAIYYKELLYCFGDPKRRKASRIEDNEKDIKSLNDDLNNVKECLAIYLKTQTQNHETPCFNDISLHKGQGFMSYEDPDEVFILNFNYTTPKFKRGATKINIHGTLNDVESMIFGYGDEADEIYPEIEKADIDEYLRNFKSHCYIQSNNYKDLSEFIDAEEYQVMTVGHSCGRSDHVLLGEIFNHENCKEIEVNYHQFSDGRDDFNSIAFNIGRAMPNKVEYRRKLKSKENCRTIAELHEE